MLSFNIGLNKFSIPELADNDTNNLFFESFKFQEMMGGSIPTLELAVSFKDEKNTKILNIGDEITYEIRIKNKSRIGTGSLYSINKQTNSCIFKFFCVKKDFIRKICSNISYKSYEEALESCLPFDISDESPKSPNGNMEIHRLEDTNYSLFNKLMQGYKDNCIYGIKSGSVVVVDVRDWNIDDNEENKLSFLGNFKLNKPVEISSNKYYDYFETEIKLDDGIRNALKYGNDISFYNKEFDDFYRSVAINTSIRMNPKVILNGNVENSLCYEIGDCVMITGLNIEQEKFFVNSFIISVSRNGQVNIDYSFASYE